MKVRHNKDNGTNEQQLQKRWSIGDLFDDWILEPRINGEVWQRWMRFGTVDNNSVDQRVYSRDKGCNKKPVTEPTY